MSSVDCVYLAACAGDARLARICVASIRYFHPDVPIRLLAGGILQRGLADELHRYWGVDLVDLPRGEYGWGFVKLEPLFGESGERFLVLDSDTVLTGPVLDKWSPIAAPFLVDDEQQSDTDARWLYYDWDLARAIDPAAPRPAFLFNSGQWFGTAGVLSRDDFTPWIEWTMPRQLRHPACFKQGDQGLLNYVLNQKSASGAVSVQRQRLMCWPGHGMQELTVDAVRAGTAPALVVHWAGMKSTRLRKMVGADVLLHFERFYYGRMPAGRRRRALDTGYHVWLQWKHFIRVRLLLAYRKWLT